MFNFFGINLLTSGATCELISKYLGSIDSDEPSSCSQNEWIKKCWRHFFKFINLGLMYQD